MIWYHVHPVSAGLAYRHVYGTAPPDRNNACLITCFFFKGSMSLRSKTKTTKVLIKLL